MTSEILGPIQRSRYCIDYALGWRISEWSLDIKAYQFLSCEVIFSHYFDRIT